MYTMSRWALPVLCVAALAGCSVFGLSPEQLNALKGDGACVGVVGAVNQPIYGNAGLGVARLNSPGTISVAKDGTISCTIQAAPK